MNSYVLITVPTRQIIEFVDKLRDRFASYTNYVIPPHITIYPPFYIKNSTEKNIIKSLNESFSKIKSQEIFLDSVDYFEGKNNVVFFKPDKKSSNFIKDLLVKATESLKGQIKNLYENYNFTPQKFRPHMTIAERIPNDSFFQVKQEAGAIKKEMKFDVSSIFLYTQKGKSKVWNELMGIKLS